MTLFFTVVCDLLEECHKLCTNRKTNFTAVKAWFARNRDLIDAPSTDLAALLSTLLPEMRPDRVFCIQPPSLEKIIGRALILGSSRIAELALYKKPGLGYDLADCVERVLKSTPNPTYPESFRVTVEEIDELLHGLAHRIKWSSPAIRASDSLTSRDRTDLENVYRRLGAVEAKWLTRLVLKDFRPLILESHLIFGLCDPLLPSIMKIRGEFSAAIKVLQQAKAVMHPDSAGTLSIAEYILASVQPKIGLKVARQQWFKARSIKHCINIGQGRMSVENKIDGEYCQIHIDVSKGRQGIQIFSKSGKDSTEDRVGLHSVILNSLRIGRPECRIRKQCILEGELVVYSDDTKKILPFHKIRQHVARRGRFLGTELDSQPKPWEHLMVIYYDMLLLDNDSLLGVRHSERVKKLESIVFPERGSAELVERQFIDFSRSTAASNLRNVFAKTITERKEGLVLKPDEPYFATTSDRNLISGHCIKLKKEYIGHFGEVGDFAVVGAGFHPMRAKSYDIQNLRWTHFYIGCLTNREEYKRWGEKPRFTVICPVELSEAQLKTFLTFADLECVCRDENRDTVLHVPSGVEATLPMTAAFKRPPVFDIRCFSFDKASSTSFWSPRFPTVAKIHFDRDFSDAMSFEELQSIAASATTNPELEDSQENLLWIARLEGADPRGVAVDAVSQLTATTMPTPSPQRHSQSIASDTSSKSAETVLSPEKRFKHLKRSLKKNYLPDIPETDSAAIVPLILPSVIDLTSDNRDSHSGRKRAVESDTRIQREVKRARCIEMLQTTMPSHEQEAESVPTRKPLVDIVANASQQSRQTIQPSEDDDIYLLESTKPQELLDHDQVAPYGSQTSVVLERNSSMILAATEPCAAHSQQLKLPVDQVGPKTKECKYSGSKCVLASCLIFMPPNLLQHSKELRELLDSHGVLDVTANLDEWIQNESQSISSQASGSVENKRILLVDSVDRKAEMKALSSEVGNCRGGITVDNNNWISVYDWRVLKHLTILEDKNTIRKYYDGFSDPWRRWYCGLV